MNKPKKNQPTVTQLLRQIDKLKKELAKYKPTTDFSDPQTGHERWQAEYSEWLKKHGWA